MKAVIMAGGEGSRLRPLTCDIPKPMAPLLNRPVIEYILDLLDSHGITDACVTTQYLPDIISGHFQNGKYKGIELDFFEETTPLGTAGSVKNAAEGFEDDFIVISGDAMCDFDLTAAMRFHKKNQSTATLIVTKISDPREYGLVSFDKDGKIEGFLEKPDYSQASTSFANTGIYILSPRIFRFIPSDSFYDFGKNVFPLLLIQKEDMFAYTDSGYWCDIGDLISYRECQFDMMSGKVRFEKSVELLPTGDFQIVEPCRIEGDVSIGKGAVIGPNAVIADGTVIGAETKIRDSIIHSNVKIGQKVTVTGAVICKGAAIKDCASVFEGAVAGSDSRIGTGATVDNNVKIWPQKQVENRAAAKKNVKFGLCRNDIFDDDGICGEIGTDITPEYLCRLGSAAGSLKNISKIGVAASSDKASKALKKAFISGILGAGAAAWDFGSCFEGMFNFALQFCNMDIGVYISAGNESVIRIKSISGLPLPRGLERDIEAFIARNEYKSCTWDKYKDVVEMQGIRHLYINEVIKHSKGIYEDTEFDFTTQNSLIKAVADEVLQKTGSQNGNAHTFSISREGDRVYYYYKDNPPIWHEQLLAVCCLDEFTMGCDVALPYDAPIAADELASEHGRTVLRYLSCPADDSDSEARKLAAKQLWARDGLIMAIKAFSFSRRQGRELHEILERIPRFSLMSKQIDLSCSACDLLSKISDDSHKDVIKSCEGVVYTKNGAILHAKPDKRGQALKVIAEANDFEAASEMAVSFEEMISLDNFFQNG